MLREIQTANSMTHKRRKALYIFLGILVLLIAIRIALSPVVKWYLNTKVLADMGEYTGRVYDVDIALIRGAYAIDSLVIEKVSGEVQEPFVVLPRTDLSVEWKSLFDGAIVGEIETTNPVINFAFSSDSTQSQTGTETDWTEVVKDMMPIRINRVAVNNGRIKLVGLDEASKTDLSLKAFNLEMTNLQNVLNGDEVLPSDIIASAEAPDYSGRFHMTAQANVLRQIPNFDYNAKFEGIDMTSLNPMVKHYSGMDFEKGVLNVYSEMAMRDGTYEGYFKPLAEDMTIFRLDEDDPKGDKRSVGEFIKELFVEGASEIVENQRKQLFATRVPISGTIENSRTDVWTTIISLFTNAYIKAFQSQLDDRVDYQDVGGGGDKGKEKKDRKDKKDRKKDKD